MTPFAAAIANRHVEVACYLLATGQTNLNTQDKNCHTPVYYTIRSQNKEAVSLLLFNKEVNINVQDHLDCTPFWYTVNYCNLLAAQLLLARGVNPNMPDMDQIAPLNVAILKEDGPILKLLLD
ncbi:ankyrin repeat-containing domain protein [Aspergillus recurvatus]